MQARGILAKTEAAKPMTKGEAGWGSLFSSQNERAKESNGPLISHCSKRERSNGPLSSHCSKRERRFPFPYNLKLKEKKLYSSIVNPWVYNYLIIFRIRLV
jgi:hypothetical protein